ncbi:gamma-glutamylcyclotransferase family protein [Anaerocolumna sp. MB42-C2]|uniref:gamma-glutamylcyclotransferase family protein n=1 Tax=Anaerocolumna sp. MB42-C2 TaxID=3070997 RepID=UPI0027DEE3AB|nr:gamma-glutamylcyclotransferase family protein [Anaerocolumna sp. MB42-C2]WMJ86754.1 gamma-glutamylcyclotransferase family protein [Anaerocolumna sp. MB42-C2]
MDKNIKLYLAYGSNLNLKQMVHRCPTARVVGVSEMKDYRLLFRGAHAGAVATVEPFKGGRVPVLVWETTPADEASLDRYEGWPFLYRKETVRVKLKGKSIKAFVYIMNDGRPLGMPSCYYYNTIMEGYKDAGFDLDILRQAAKDSVESEDVVYE